jgi:HCOMODA/2-hydroxy-3-carboxy-muconic semialdehyde decarboxylase
MAGFLGHEVSVFDTAKKFGKDTDLLITDMDMADAMADCLTGSDVVLMRGHGATLCGRSLPEAVYRAIYAELNAQILLQATSLGAFTALSAGECKATVDRISPQIGRAWNLWLREVGHG